MKLFQVFVANSVFYHNNACMKWLFPLLKAVLLYYNIKMLDLNIFFSDE